MDKNSFEEQRGSAKNWRINNKNLTMIQDGNTTTIGTKLPLNPYKARYLKFKFKVEVMPQGADLSKKSLEDSAFRLFILFDKGGGWFSPPNTLTYAYGTTHRKGKQFTSPRFDNLKIYIVAGGKSELNRWITCERNILSDYQQAFGTNKVPNIKAIGIKSDANHTGAKTLAKLEFISFLEKN